MYAGLCLHDEGSHVHMHGKKNSRERWRSFGKMQHDSQCSIGRPIYVVCIETGDRMDRRQQKLMDLALSCGRKLVKNPRFYAVIVFTRWRQSRRGLFYFLSFVEINETGMIR